ncbi:MAG: hypothetical protein ACRDS1_16345 [Pseudonocardiaceae bacterium]
MPSPDRLREVASTLPEACGLVVVDITDRAAVVSGLETEQPRYYLQHALGFRCSAQVRRFEGLTGSPVPVVFPLHPRTHRHIRAFDLADLASRLWLTGPLDYPCCSDSARRISALLLDQLPQVVRRFRRGVGAGRGSAAGVRGE